MVISSCAVLLDTYIYNGIHVHVSLLITLDISHVVFVRRTTSRSSSTESFSSPVVKSEKGRPMRKADSETSAKSPFDAQEAAPSREEKPKEKKEKKEKEAGSGRTRSRSTHKRKRSEKDKEDKKDKKEKKEKEKKTGRQTKKDRSSSKEEVLDTTQPPAEPVKPPSEKPSWQKPYKGWTNQQKQKCCHCGQKIAHNKSALDQHQKFSEYCLSWQMYSRMSQQAQKAPDAWQRAQQAARKIKLSREKAVVEEVGCAPSPDRSVSPCSVRSSSVRAASVAPSVELLRPEKVKTLEELRALKSQPLDEQKTEKRKKSRKKSSSSSEEEKDKEKSRGSKGRRQMVFNFYNH